MAGYRRPGARRRRKYQVRPALLFAAAAAVVILIVVLIVHGANGGSDNVAKKPPATATPEPTPEILETAEPTLEPTPTPEPTRNPNVGYAPKPTPMAEGYLPIFKKAETDEKVICVTVDDFFQFKNARKIIDVAIENGAKLTLFPIGKNVLREELQDTLRYAHENGMEIENHTLEHKRHFQMDDATFERQIYLQCLCVDKVLGVDYQEHFVRPFGGDGRDDQRLHQYAKQIGMVGIAHWNVSGSGTGLQKLIAGLAPGNIYLFHTTDKDTAKLQEFIPAAVQAGYKLVTLNEMFGYPENETSPQTVAPEDREMLKLEAFTYTPRDYKKGNYAWRIYQMQERLIELGYLDGEPDGMYGDGTAKAVSQFQKKNGLEATGTADPETQDLIFSDDAKKK